LAVAAGNSTFAHAFIGAHIKGLFGRFLRQLLGNVLSQKFHGAIRINEVAVRNGKSEREIALVGGVLKHVIARAFNMNNLFKVFFAANVNIVPAARPFFFPLGGTFVTRENFNARAVAMGNALAVAVVFFQAMGVMV